MILVLATRNTGKVKELTALMGGEVWDIRTCATYTGCPTPEETGATFLENAILKATAIAGYTGEASLADDSGLEVDLLDGAPGVYSARYAGADATDSANNAKLLHLLGDMPSLLRTARFRCAIAVSRPDGRVFTVEGACEGRIGFTPRGSSGFGYDPLFVPTGFEESFGELGSAVKNTISHRARAFHAAARRLKSWVLS